MKSEGRMFPFVTTLRVSSSIELADDSYEFISLRDIEKNRPFKRDTRLFGAHGPALRGLEG